VKRLVAFAHRAEGEPRERRARRSGKVVSSDGTTSRVDVQPAVVKNHARLDCEDVAAGLSARSDRTAPPR
jgi:hypothetical protein